MRLPKIDTPSGFITCTAVRSEKAPVSRPGVRANEMIVTAGAAIASHRTGRHRRDGALPLGNNRKIGTNTYIAGTISQRSSQAAASPNGSEPGCFTSARFT